MRLRRHVGEQGIEGGPGSYKEERRRGVRKIMKEEGLYCVKCVRGPGVGAVIARGSPKSCGEAERGLLGEKNDCRGRESRQGEMFWN